MKNKYILVVVIVVLVGAYVFVRGGEEIVEETAPSVEAPESLPPSETAAPSVMVSVALAEQNDSGETGAVTFTDSGNALEVVIDLNGAPATPQPAHIHEGSCDDLGGIVYPLSNVIDGESTSFLDISLDDLPDQLPLAVNVHMSSDDLGTYVACGDIEV